MGRRDDETLSPNHCVLVVFLLPPQIPDKKLGKILTYSAKNTEGVLAATVAILKM